MAQLFVKQIAPQTYFAGIDDKDLVKHGAVIVANKDIPLSQWSDFVNHAILLPNGTTAQRPSGVDEHPGHLRYNVDDDVVEAFFADDGWKTLATELDELTDVTISTLSDGQILRYDAGTSQWINTSPQIRVVPDIATRNALSPLYVGDMAFVQDTGEGEYALYLWDGTQWNQISDQDSSDTDAETFELSYSVGDSTTQFIHRVSPGSSVDYINIIVETAFDDPNATITVGDELSPPGSRSRLFWADLADLSVAEEYINFPNTRYDFVTNEVEIFFYVNPATSVTGSFRIIFGYK